MNLALWAAKTGLDAQNTRMAVICQQPGEHQHDGLQGRPRRVSGPHVSEHPAGGRAEHAEHAVHDRARRSARACASSPRKRTTPRAACCKPAAVWTCRSTAAASCRSPCRTAPLPTPATAPLPWTTRATSSPPSGYPLQPAINIPAGTQSVTDRQRRRRHGHFGDQPQGHPGRPDSAGRFHQRRGLAAHRQQLAGRIRRQRIAAGRHRRAPTGWARCSRARSKPRT